MGQEVRKKSFIFNVEWQEVLLGYPSEVRLEVYDAIIEYVASGTLSELKPMAKMAFSFIKKEIDYNAVKYNEVVSKRKEAGKKGAMVKQTKQKEAKQANASKCQQKEANQADNDNVYDNDILDKKKILSDESIKEKALSALSYTAPEYAKFVKWLIEKAPYCFEHMKLPTEAEFIKLKKLGTTQQITEVIQQIENRKDLRKRYSNLYRTILNWMKHE